METVDPMRDNKEVWDNVRATTGSEQVRDADADQRPSTNTDMEAVPMVLHVTTPLLETVSAPTGAKLQVPIDVSSFCVPSE